MTVKQEIEAFTRKLLEQRLAKVTPEQRAFFEKIYPGKVPASKLVDAIELCDRTIIKNEKKAKLNGES